MTGLFNDVILRCGATEIALADMRQGSAPVQAGDTVAAGQPLRGVSDFGASRETPPRIHAQRPVQSCAQGISDDPLGLRIDRRPRSAAAG
ncbi:hypothetical protein SAMN05421759_11042 [Roseivivax lentus]|uniref:Uncharacterized protein n=1 Tax=Roseivivax lentus TaxID=633194 RepID=A0A1N7NTL3_9RHOB|nr:hypothetical protein [Roseivivax lentus]SIT01622.1 hypothetical protein SAMN05421759_11042 [Roseivivax lentus]